MLNTIQYYLPTYIWILQRDCLVLFPFTTCAHYLYVFDTFHFAVTQNNRTTQAQYFGFNSDGFNRLYKNQENVCNTHTFVYGCHIIIPVT